MPTIKTHGDFTPAAAFMESAAMNLNATMNFLLESIDKASALGATSDGVAQYTVTVNVLNPDHSAAFGLPLHTVLNPLALVSTIMNLFFVPALYAIIEGLREGVTHEAPHRDDELKPTG